MKAIFTAQMLRDVGACSDQIDKFVEHFGESVNVTEARARRVSTIFDWDYATRFLDAQGRAEHNRVTGLASAEYKRVTGLALAEYKRVTDPALAEYKRVRALAWAEHNRVTGLALAEYKRVRALASAEYKRVTDPAWAEYNRVRALAWAAAYIATCARRKVRS